MNFDFCVFSVSGPVYYLYGFLDNYIDWRRGVRRCVNVYFDAQDLGPDLFFTVGGK